MKRGDGDKLPRLPLQRITDWSSKHINGELKGMEGEQFWFEGAEGWRVMGWAIKPRGWKRSDTEEGKVWPMGAFVHTHEAILTLLQHSSSSELRIEEIVSPV